VGTRIVLAVGAVAVLIVAITSVGSTPARTVSQQLVTAKRGVVQSTVSGSGTLSPRRQADADFGTTGTVTSIHVKVGQHVNAGDVLANLDTGADEAQLAGAQAGLQNADDDLTSAETATSSSATTTPASTGRGSTSTASSAGSTMSVAAAQAAVDSAQVTLRNAETALEKTALHAPISGTVASINGAVGDTVGGGASGSGSSSSSSSSSSGFIVLAQVHRFTMSLSLTESDIGSVKVGQAATVTVNAADGQEFSAHVSSIGVLASSSSASASSGSSSSAVSYPVTLTLDQTGSRLKPGMSASADIITQQQSGISVPTQAIQGSTVTVVRGGKQTPVAVQTGIAGGSNTIITSGVKAGEQVVVTSVSAAAGAAANGAGAGNNAAGGLRRFGGAGGGVGSALGGGGGFRGGGGFGGGPPAGAGGG
jgi:macrolide-specific efflux system membrane fusion protein